MKIGQWSTRQSVKLLHKVWWLQEVRFLHFPSNDESATRLSAQRGVTSKRAWKRMEIRTWMKNCRNGLCGLLLVKETGVGIKSMSLPHGENTKSWSPSRLAVVATTMRK